MCRDFEPTAIPPDVLHRVTESATRAPTAGNTRGLDIVVLRGDQTDRYWDVSLPPPRRDGFAWPGLLRAPVLLLPYVEPQAYVRRYAEPDKAASSLGEAVADWTVPYWFVDGGAAVMAMLLSIEAEGLGALFFGQFEHEASLRGALGVPDGRRTLGTIALGYPRVGGESRSASAHRGRPLPEDVMHEGGW